MKVSDLKVGQFIKYIGPNPDFYETVCLVEEINKFSLQFTAKIVQPGAKGYTVWRTGRSSGIFDNYDVYKFSLVFQTTTTEDKIILKIKQLDSKWIAQQKQKGKDNALLCL